MSETEKQTVEIEKPPSWAIAMREQMVQGFAMLRADVGLVADDVKLTKDRITVVEGRVATLEEARQRNSERAKGQSAVDAAQEAQLAQERSAREELTKRVVALDAKADTIEAKTDAQTAILARLDKLTANPTVKLFAHAVVVAFLYWLASKGIKVQ